jgi:hypothetical protein
MDKLIEREVGAGQMDWLDDICQKHGSILDAILEIVEREVEASTREYEENLPAYVLRAAGDLMRTPRRTEITRLLADMTEKIPAPATGDRLGTYAAYGNERGFFQTLLWPMLTKLVKVGSTKPWMTRIESGLLDPGRGGEKQSVAGSLFQYFGVVPDPEACPWWFEDKNVARAVTRILEKKDDEPNEIAHHTPDGGDTLYVTVGPGRIPVENVRPYRTAGEQAGWPAMARALEHLGYVPGKTWQTLTPPLNKRPLDGVVIRLMAKGALRSDLGLQPDLVQAANGDSRWLSMVLARPETRYGRHATSDKGFFGGPLVTGVFFPFCGQVPTAGVARASSWSEEERDTSTWAMRALSLLCGVMPADVSGKEPEPEYLFRGYGAGSAMLFFALAHDPENPRWFLDLAPDPLRLSIPVTEKNLGIRNRVLLDHLLSRPDLLETEVWPTEWETSHYGSCCQRPTVAELILLAAGGCQEVLVKALEHHPEAWNTMVHLPKQFRDELTGSIEAWDRNPMPLPLAVLAFMDPGHLARLTGDNPEPYVENVVRMAFSTCANPMGVVRQVTACPQGRTNLRKHGLTADSLRDYARMYLGKTALGIGSMDGEDLSMEDDGPCL